MADIVMIFLGKEIGFGRSVAWWMEKKVSEEQIGGKWGFSVGSHQYDPERRVHSQGQGGWNQEWKL